MEPIERKLIAVLCADVKDYSQHMQRDEDGTIHRLNEYRRLFDQTIADHKGRIANTAGDSVVAEFASVREAVTCAVQVQNILREQNQALAPAEQLHFRIGINLGDVIRKGKDILGDGVNIAARIESTAEPGGIAFSGSVYDSIKNKLPYQYAFQGEQSLKNITEPVRVYKVLLEEARTGVQTEQPAVSASPPTPHSSPLTSHPSPLIPTRPLTRTVPVAVGMILALVVVLIAIYWLRNVGEGPVSPPTASPTESMVATQAPATAPTPAPARLPNSVAVLPFENMSPDPNNAYFADGLHEEILNQLAKIKALNVIARTTMRQYANTDKSMQTIADELNVETVMEGSVRYADNHIRVTTQLINPTTDVHLWSETYEHEFKNIFTIESEIAMNVANAMKVEFSPAEQATIGNRPTTSTEAYSLYLQAISSGEVAHTHELLDQALELDPDFAIANGLKAWLYSQLLTNTTAGDAVSAAERDELERLVRLYAERAIALDPTVPLAHTALADIHFTNWRWTEAQRAFEHALESSPNDDSANQYLGFLYSYTGQHEKAIRQSGRFRALNPRNNNIYVNIASTFAYAGDYDRAAETLRRVIDLSPNTFYHAWLAFMEIARGDNETAFMHLQLSEEQLGENPPIVFLPEIAYAYGRLQRHADAQRLFDRIKKLSAKQEIGLGGWIMAYAAIGDYDHALELLKLAAEKAADGVVDEGFFNLMNFKMNFMNDPVLERPEFVEVRNQIVGK